MKFERVYKPDADRQVSALLVLLSTASATEGRGAEDALFPFFGAEVPFACLREDQTVAIIWSVIGPPVGDAAGEFVHVRPILVDGDELNDEERSAALLAQLWADEVRCDACGAPLLYEGLPCVCELANRLAA